MIPRNIFISCLIFIQIKAEKFNGEYSTKSVLASRPCNDNDFVHFTFERKYQDENVYNLQIAQYLPKYSLIEVTFEPTAIILAHSKYASIEKDGNVIRIVLDAAIKDFSLWVKSSANGIVPRITSLTINYVQYCKKPNNVINKNVQQLENTQHVSLSAPMTPSASCGKKKDLITNGPPKPGDWPWHVAIYKKEKKNINYICGGTLISQTVVLTVAHCVTVRGTAVPPDTLFVTLGKFYLYSIEKSTQQKKVQQIIVNENFDSIHTLNDIALLKLDTPATFNEFVQPACVWREGYYQKLTSSNIYGTAVGWGFDYTYQLSNVLKQDELPKISDLKCLKRKPEFYSRTLNEYNFCAGRENGTLICNGDAGGGYHVFVPDEPQNSASRKGRWHVHGIVSLAVVLRNSGVCDPSQYVVFTDVGKFSEWIDKNIQ